MQEESQIRKFKLVIFQRHCIMELKRESEIRPAVYRRCSG